MGVAASVRLCVGVTVSVRLMCVGVAVSVRLCVGVAVSVRFTIVIMNVNSKSPFNVFLSLFYYRRMRC